MVEESLRRREKSDSQGILFPRWNARKFEHVAMELNLGMINKKRKCPTISKEPQQSFQAYSLHISFQEHR